MKGLHQNDGKGHTCLSSGMQISVILLTIVLMFLVTGMLAMKCALTRQDSILMVTAMVLSLFLLRSGRMIRRQQDILRESEERFRLLVNGVQDYAIFMLDPEGHVVTWNEGAERIKGHRADEILGRHFSCFYPSDAIEGGFPEYELKEAAEKGRFEDEGWRVRKDGSQFWANVVITAMRNERGRLRGFSKAASSF